MKVTFFSNYLTHHQIPVSNELYKVLGDNYKFISCEPMQSERAELGWSLSSTYPYEIKAYISEETKQEAMKLAIESDVVIIGAAPREYLKIRINQRKLTIRYIERYFKKSRWKILNPREFRVKFLYDFCYRYKKYVHVLCAGAYAAEDCRFIQSYPGRMYKWGYFPENSKKSFEELINIKSKKIKIVWVARFISWKHPMDAIKVCEKLVKKGYNFEMKMIGTGPLEEECKNYVSNNKLSKYIKFEGACNSKEVQVYMSKSHILLHTADRNEGWGAVINEAMSNACAIVANKMVGSVSYMIEDGYNGLITDGTIDKYVSCIERYILDSDFKIDIAKSAYKTIHEIWSPENAAKNLIKLAENLLYKKENNIIDGPGSKA